MLAEGGVMALDLEPEYNRLSEDEVTLTANAKVVAVTDSLSSAKVNG